MNGPYNRIKVTDISGIAVVDFISTDRKIQDHQHIKQMGEELFALVNEGGKRKIILNFENVQCCNDHALQKFLNLHKIVKEAEGKLVLCSIPTDIIPVLRSTGLNKIFNIAKDLPTIFSGVDAFFS